MDNQDLKIDLIPVEYSTLADRVEMKLIEVFQSSKLKPGDPIPKEKDLAVMMGVSRTVIREALVRLKTMGLLAAKKHKGTVISSPNISVILKKSIIPGVLDRHTLMDLFEMRLALEVGMADFIFSRKTEADIEQLEDIVDIEPVHSASMVFNVDQEIRFHGKLYEMSGNPKRVKEVTALVRRMAARPDGVTPRELARAGRMSVSRSWRGTGCFHGAAASA